MPSIHQVIIRLARHAERFITQNKIRYVKGKKRSLRRIMYEKIKNQLKESNNFEITKDDCTFTHHTNDFQIHFDETIQIIGFKGKDHNVGQGYLIVEYSSEEPSFEEIVAFERRYCGGESNTYLSFSKALEFLKEGKRVRRSGWNGKGMWLRYVKAVSQWQMEEEFCDLHNGIELLDFIGMKTADEKFVPWLASQTDLIANDWEIQA